MSSRTKANSTLIDLFDELSARMHKEAHATFEYIDGRRTIVITKKANDVTVKYMLYVDEYLKISDYPGSSIRILMDNGSACDPDYDKDFDPDDYRSDLDVPGIGLLSDDVQKYIAEHLDADSKKRFEIPAWLQTAPKNQWFEHDGEPTIVGDNYQYGNIDDGSDMGPLGDWFTEDDALQDGDDDRIYSIWGTRRAGSCHKDDTFYHDLYHSLDEAKKAVETNLGL